MNPLYGVYMFSSMAVRHGNRFCPSLQVLWLSVDLWAFEAYCLMHLNENLKDLFVFIVIELSYDTVQKSSKIRTKHDFNELFCTSSSAYHTNLYSRQKVWHMLANSLPLFEEINTIT